jgi:hypothetical protein
MDIPDLVLDAHRRTLVERRPGSRDQFVVERPVEVMILPLTIVDRYPRLGRRAME